MANAVFLLSQDSNYTKNQENIVFHNPLFKLFNHSFGKNHLKCFIFNQLMDFAYQPCVVPLFHMNICVNFGAAPRP